jgi:hypothetical protein
MKDNPRGLASFTPRAIFVNDFISAIDLRLSFP